MFQLVYQQPLSRIIAWMILLPAFWGLLAALAQRMGYGRIWTWLNRILTVLCVYLTFRLTFLERGSGTYSLVLHPAAKLEAAVDNPELYREMLMNVFLFVPFGMTAFFALRSEAKSLLAGFHIVLLVIIFGCLCSVFVEVLQYVYSCGNVESSDVICNTLGAAIGTSTGGFARIAGYILRRYEERKNVEERIL